MKKIRIGVMGCADIARRIIIPNIIQCDRFELVAVASRSYAKAQSYSKQFYCDALEGYQTLLDRQDIDTIYIPLPTALHHEWIIKSLKAGKHVFSEKSIALNYQETLEIIEVAKKQKLVVFENFMFMYHSQIEFIKTKIAEGKVGTLRLFRSSFGFPPFDEKNNIRYKKELGGGSLLDAGSYTLMAAQLFLGDEQNIKSAVLNDLGNNVDFQGAIQLENKDHVVSQLAFGFDNFYQNTIELWGTSGKITIERAFTAPSGFSPKVIIEKQGIKEEIVLPHDNQCAKILFALAEAINSNSYDIKYKQILNQALLINQVNDYAKR